MVSQATGLEFEYLKVSQATGLVSQAMDLVSQATGLEFEYLQVSQGTGPVSQATGLRKWYLKLRGWNLSISRYLNLQGWYFAARETISQLGKPFRS